MGQVAWAVARVWRRHGAALHLERDRHVRARERPDQAVLGDRVADGALSRGACEGRRADRAGRRCRRRSSRRRSRSAS